MKRFILQTFMSAILIFLTVQQTLSGDFEVICQVTGPIETNCYLLYDVDSKEAALFDVGGAVDSLISLIYKKELKLKFIFATHCHMDHIEGVPLIVNKFPDAQLCYNRDDYQDFFSFREWFTNSADTKELEDMMQDSGFAKWFSYDLSIFHVPDVYLEDNQIFKLGNLEIKTILSPSHSRGSICFYFDNVLFSGDVLFYRTVGRTDLPGGSTEEIVKSVRRLYTQLPDETKVYLGITNVRILVPKKEKTRR